MPRRHALAALVLSTALALPGCGIPLGGTDFEDKTAESLITGSVTDDGVTDVDPADWKTVQDHISFSFSTLEDGSTTRWVNEVTGSNGLISALPPEQDAAGELCRPFRTTLDSVSGVEIFVGKACRQANGTWRITRIGPADGGQGS